MTTKTDEEKDKKLTTEQMNQFLSWFVHDMRNPLSTLRMNIEFTLPSVTDDSVRESLEDSLHAVNELVVAVERLQWLKRIAIKQPAIISEEGCVLESIKKNEYLNDKIKFISEKKDSFIAKNGQAAGDLVVPLVQWAFIETPRDPLLIDIRKTNEMIEINIIDEKNENTFNIQNSELNLSDILTKASSKRGTYGGLYLLNQAICSIGGSLCFEQKKGRSIATLFLPV